MMLVVVMCVVVGLVKEVECCDQVVVVGKVLDGMFQQLQVVKCSGDFVWVLVVGEEVLLLLLQYFMVQIELCILYLIVMNCSDEDGVYVDCVCELLVWLEIISFDYDWVVVVCWFFCEWIGVV